MSVSKYKKLLKKISEAEKEARKRDALDYSHPWRIYGNEETIKKFEEAFKPENLNNENTLYVYTKIRS